MKLIVDLEATCWETPNVPDLNEIIDIGIVICNDSYEIVDFWESLVKPKINPVLSSFCRKLTAITQSQINSARSLDVVFSEFLAKMGDTDLKKVLWHTWGSWDLKCLQNDCNRNGITFPFGEHIDLKRKYTEKRKNLVEAGGLKAALNHEGFEINGHWHRGLADAQGAAKIAKLLFDEDQLAL